MSEVPLGDLINWTQAEYDREVIAVARLTAIHQLLVARYRTGAPSQLPTEIGARKLRRHRYGTLLARLRELQDERSKD